MLGINARFVFCGYRQFSLKQVPLAPTDNYLVILIPIKRNGGNPAVPASFFPFLFSRAGEPRAGPLGAHSRPASNKTITTTRTRPKPPLG